MSGYDDSEMEVDDQSEDGELKKSPVAKSPMLDREKVNELDFSLSSDEADTADSLDIKPPQAAVHHKDRMRRHEKNRDRRAHKESHRKSHHRIREHRDRREERHREKRHHRDRRDVREKRERDIGRERERERVVVEDLRDRLNRDKHERRVTERSKTERSVKVERPKETSTRRAPPEETAKEKADRIETEKRKERLLLAGWYTREVSGGGKKFKTKGQQQTFSVVSMSAGEMERQKETYRRELEARRQRRHLEREKERTLEEIKKKRERSRSRERKRKKDGEDKPKADGDKETKGRASPSHGKTTVVTVSDDDEPMERGASDRKESEGDDTEENSETEEESSAESGSTSATEAGSDETVEEQPAENGKYNSPPVENERNPKVEQTPEEEDEEEVDAKKRNESDEEEDAAYVADSPKSDIVLKEELPPYLPAIQGCRSVEEFQCLNRIEEGTYGVVYRARDKRTNEIVALKRLKMEKEKEGFPITSLREINTLLKAQHPNIVTVREIVVGSNMDKIFIVMDYVEHDLKSLMETMKQKKQVFIPGEIKCLMQQLLRAVAHLHDNWILHRDLKTSNLLLSHKGILKVGDFGLAREYGSPLKPYTPIVVTLWYRSPELLLCTKEYSTPVDMWSVGCIFGEFLSMEPLFPGKSEVDQLNRIFKDLGTPNEKIWPGYGKLPAVQKMTFTEYPLSQLHSRFGTMLTEVGLDLMKKFLTYDPTQRVTAEEAIHHDYFKEAPLPIDPAMFPTWPAKSEQGHRKIAASPKPPSGGREYKQLGDTDDDVSVGGFHMGVVEKGRSAMGAGFSLKF